MAKTHKTISRHKEVILQTFIALSLLSTIISDGWILILLVLRPIACSFYSLLGHIHAHSRGIVVHSWGY